MKSSSLIITFLFSIVFVGFTQQGTSTSKGVSVNSKGAAVQSTNGGKAVANSNGSTVKNKNGGGVEAKKGEVSTKSSSGNGAAVNSKGVNVKGNNGGMTIDKNKLEIKSKAVNIKLGK